MLLIAVINVIIYFDYWAGTTVFTGKDTFTAYMPLINFEADCLREGSLPLWNPFLNFGFPYVEDVLNSSLFPTQFLMALVTGSSMVIYQRELLLWIFLGGQILNSTELHEIEPALLPQVIGGIQYVQDAHLDPARFVMGLAEKAKTLGVRILTKTEVLGLDVTNSRVTSVRTTRGNLSAKQYVLAGGAWSPAIVREMKIKLPIQAAKGYSITLERPHVSPKIPLMFGEARVVVTPLGDRLRLAGTLELAGMDLSIDLRRVTALPKNSVKYLPGLDHRNILQIWRGLRPARRTGCR